MKDRNLTTRIKFFSSNEKGSVAIEFVLIMIVLAFIFAFMADLVFMRSSLGKLDNASYSLVNVLRERRQLYDETISGSKTITNSDLVTFRKLASQILYGDNSHDNDVIIVLEQLTFTEETPILPHTKLGDDSKCPPATSLDKLKDLSPRSEINGERKIPLYQVTVCMNIGSGLFRALLAKDSTKLDGMLRSSSLGVSR
ncbi:tight adherence pilus pseudopilin TadF [Lonepinella koalarum]|uniref:tight adherence pilus pseudopilin TadF n=1 Tax=Lonepinella koalarum TaxID=53417 RepID=UPI003F6DF8F9